MTDLGEEKPSDGREDKPAEGDGERARQDRFIDLKLSHVVEIILTLALVLIACLQYAVYWRQAGIMEAQVGIADQQNLIAKAAQRAFVGISRVDVVKPKDLSDSKATWKITPVIENSGGTPAVDVSLVFVDPIIEIVSAPTGMDFDEYKATSDIVGSPRDPDDLFDKPVKPNTFSGVLLSHATVGPKSTLITSGLGIEYKYFAIGNTQGHFLYGSIRYFDTFEPIKRHLTKFCFSMVSLEASPRTDEWGDPPFLCTHWNCTDDYCKADREAYDRDWKQALTKREADRSGAVPKPLK